MLSGLERDRAELRKHVVRRRVGDPGDVPDGEHLGMAGNAEIRFYRDTIAVLELEAERFDKDARLQAGAPQQRVRLDDRPRFEGDARRADRGHHLAQQHLHAALLQRLARVGADIGLEHRHERRAGLDEDDARLVLRDPGVVLGEVAAIQLGQSAGALDARGPAAHDDDADRAVLHQRRVPVRRLPSP